MQNRRKLLNAAATAGLAMAVGLGPDAWAQSVPTPPSTLTARTLMSSN
jgi:nitrous oxide reductase